MIATISIITLIVAVLLTAFGCYLLIIETKLKGEVATSSKDALTDKGSSKDDNPVVEQGAVSDLIDSAAKLAEALPKLSSGTQVLTIAVVLYGISALAAGVETIATSI